MFTRTTAHPAPGAGNPIRGRNSKMPPAPSHPNRMPVEKYTPFRPLPLSVAREWPNRQIEKAPVWCSVDLRDGNQALIDPMDPGRKMRMFKALVKMGFKEIEVGFPSASQPDYDFIRQLIDDDLIPEDVTIQVLTQCRRGPDRADVRVPARRKAGDRPLLQLDLDPAAARRLPAREGRRHEHRRRSREDLPASRRRSSPARGSATSTRPRASPGPSSSTRVDICAAVMDVIEPTPQKPIILNLPATVEMFTPEHLRRLDRVVQPQRPAPRLRGAVAPPAQRPRHGRGRGRARA